MRYVKQAFKVNAKRCPYCCAREILQLSIRYNNASGTVQRRMECDDCHQNWVVRYLADAMWEPGEREMTIQYNTKIHPDKAPDPESLAVMKAEVFGNRKE